MSTTETTFVKQCKGKDITKIPLSKRPMLRSKYIAMKKYDGNYIQIHKKGSEVKFYTSGGKEFYWTNVADELLRLSEDFILECEYIADTKGLLGDRTSCSTGTYRANYSKGIANDLPLGYKIAVFDIIDTTLTALQRIGLVWQYIKPNTSLHLFPIHYKVTTLLEANEELNEYIAEGGEGMFLRHIDHMYKEGKRLNDAIKLKHRPTADLKCVEVKEGEGKYIGMIGSLVLEDSAGIRVDVGSGLSDEDRKQYPMYFIGKVIEIQYEQMLDTYIQPVFIGIREDKTEGE